MVEVPEKHDPGGRTKAGQKAIRHPCHGKPNPQDVEATRGGPERAEEVGTPLLAPVSRAIRLESLRDEAGGFEVVSEILFRKLPLANDPPNLPLPAQVLVAPRSHVREDGVSMGKKEAAPGQVAPPLPGDIRIVISRQEDRSSSLFGTEVLQLRQSFHPGLTPGSAMQLAGVAVEDDRLGSRHQRPQRVDGLDESGRMGQVQIGENAHRLLEITGNRLTHPLLAMPSRCRTASKRHTPVATLTFRHSTCPLIGI